MKVWKIGSDNNNDLVISDPAVEKHHAELQFDGTTIIVRDLKSQKGTFVNDWRVKQKVIQPTDKLMIGREWIDIDALLLKEPMGFENKNTIEEPKLIPIKEDTAKPKEVEEPQVVQLTPERKTFLESQKPKSWYHNYPLLWGTVIALFAWSAFLMYDHFSDKQGGLIITPEEKIRYDFLKANFTAKKLKIRNTTNTTIEIKGIIVMRFDSTEKSIAVRRELVPFSAEMKHGSEKEVEKAGRVFFADIIYQYTDEYTQETKMKQFAAHLSSESPHFKDNAVEISFDK